MNLKQSIYNQVFSYDDKTILYNSRSKIIVDISQKKDLILDLIENPSSDNDEMLRQKLINDSFLIDASCDEVALSSFEHFENIMSNNLSLIILPTEQCNFRCPYCYEDLKNNHLTEEKENTIKKYIAKNIKKFSNINISWFGGEPLLKKDSINRISQSVIDICKKQNKIYYSSLVTNGYYLDVDTFKEMLNNRVFQFQITLDGPKEFHDKIKFLHDGKGSFDKVLNNLIQIKDNIKSSYFRIVIRTNLTKESLVELPKYLKLLNKHFGDDNRFSFLFRPVGDWGGENVKNMKEKLITDNSNIYNMLITYGKGLNYSINYDLMRTNICEANLKNSFVINPDLQIFKCTMLFNHESNKLGYLTKKGDMIIDKSKLSKWVINENKNKNSKCTSCKLLPSCHETICPANRVAFNKEHNCGYELSNLEELMKLFTIGNYQKKYKFIKQY